MPTQKSEAPKIKEVQKTMLDSSQRKNADLWFFVIIVGFAYSVYYFYFQGVVLNHQYPDNTFLHNPGEQFDDFRNVVVHWYQYLPNDPSPNISYFPATYVVVSIFQILANISSTTISLLCLFAIFIAGVVKTSFPYLNFLDRHVKIIFLFVVLFFSFPFIFAFDRGNFELIVYFLLSLSFYSYRKKRDFSAGFFLGFAGAMKLFPGLLIFVFVFQKRWKAVKSTILSAIIATFLALLYLPGGIVENIERMLLNMSLFNQVYAIGDSGLNYGNSIFGVIKIANKAFCHYDVRTLLSVYVPSVIITFFIILYLLYRNRNFIELWQYISVLVIIMNIFPMVSADYKLIHLFIPVLHWLDESKTKPSGPYWLLWGLLFIPKQYTWLNGYYEGIIIDPLLMLTLLVIIFVDVERRRKLTMRSLSANIH